MANNSPAQAPAPTRAAVAGIRALFWPLSLMMSVVVALTIWAIVESQDQYREREAARIEAMADLRAGQVATWLRENLGRVEFAGRSPMGETYLLWRNEGDTAAHERLLNRLSSFHKASGGHSVLVMDDQGQVVAGTTNAEQQAPPLLRDAAQRAIDSNKPQFTNLYGHDGAPPAPRIDVVAPFTLTGKPARGAGGETRPPRLSVSDAARMAAAQPQCGLRAGTARRRFSGRAQFRNPLAAVLARPAGGQGYTRRCAARSGRRRTGFPRPAGAGRGAPDSGNRLVSDGQDGQRRGLCRRVAQCTLDRRCGHAGPACDWGWRLLVPRAPGPAVCAHRTRPPGREIRALQLLDAIAQGSTDSIFAKDRTGRYLLCNKAGCEALGKTMEEVIGSDDRALFPPAEAARLAASDAQALTQGRTISYEVELTTPARAVHLLHDQGPLAQHSGRGDWRLRHLARHHRAQPHQR
ncbi:PAS domain-containing protein [Polaromonas sp. P1(28)-8]|nr:PAS domain-containing protein [Polaromonas sp. P1(28)-8]